jgi:hypothetical protein
MARKKPQRNVYQRFADEWLRPSYNRVAGRVLYGEHDILSGYEQEPVVNPVLKRWIDALTAFDDRDHHDAAPLTRLLESGDVEMPPIVGIWLADLVQRHGIKCNQGERHSLADALKGFKPSPTSGRPKGVAYDLPDHIAALHVANDEATNHRETHGGTVDDAIAAVALKNFPHDPEACLRYVVTLRNFREGRNTSARLAAKRRS